MTVIIKLCQFNSIDLNTKTMMLDKLASWFLSFNSVSTPTILTPPYKLLSTAL